MHSSNSTLEFRIASKTALAMVWGNGGFVVLASATAFSMTSLSLDGTSTVSSVALNLVASLTVQLSAVIYNTSSI